MSFSKLSRFPKAVVGFGSDISELVQNINKVSNKALEMEQPIADTLNNFTDISHMLKEEAIPQLTSSLEGVNEVSSNFSRLLSMMENLISPFLSAYKLLSDTWSSVVRLLFSIMNKAGSGQESLLDFLAAQLPQEIMWPLAIMVALSSLVLISYCLPVTFVNIIKEILFKVCIAVKAFVIGIVPEAWVPEWLASFCEVMPQCVNAQGPAPSATTSSEVNGFSFSDMLTSIVSIGFISIIYSVVGVNKPGRKNSNPISEILCATGDHASKINQLFIFFRNVKTSLGDTLLWVGEWLCEATGFASPLTATINAVLNTKLFEWFKEVQEVTSPQNRLENFSNHLFLKKVEDLRERAFVFEAEFAKFPISPFVVTRFNYAISKLDKMLQDATSHKGVGQFRDEPFCVQFYGKPGCGKTVTMNFLINDLLNRRGEPKRNRLYALSSKDGYWSNYNHQVAVLIDDFGQVLDAANQHDDVKDLIFLKSSAPMTLPMAAVEEKGMQFTSRYIFLTSNFPTPSRTAGVMDLKAVQRRRNVLVNVEGSLDQDLENPTENMRFTVVSSVEPFRPIDEWTDLTYTALLDVIEMQCVRHWEKSAKLQKFSSGLEAQGPMMQPQQIVDAAAVVCTAVISQRMSEEFLLSSLKYAYKGSLSIQRPFEEGSAPDQDFEHVSNDIKITFHQWKSTLLEGNLSDAELQFWQEQIDENFRANFMAWLPMYKFNEEKFMKLSCLGHGRMQMCIEAEDEDALALLLATNQRSQFACALVLRNFQALMKRAEAKKEKPSWCKKILEFIKHQWDMLPPFIKTALKIYALYKCASLACTAVSAFFPSVVSSTIPATVSAATIESAFKGTGQGNVSGDETTLRGRGKKQGDRFLTAQSHLFDDWAAWAQKDPFLNESLIKNMVVIRLPYGGVFRGVYVRSGWILTVGHAFLHSPDGMVITIVHQHSTQVVAFNKACDFYKPIPDQDLCLIFVGDIDGLKKDIVSHFARRNSVICSVASKAVLAKPSYSSEVVGELVKVELTGVSMLTNGAETVTYHGTGFKLTCAESFPFQFPGQDGDCGSLLLAPAIGNKQPVICGVHCAGYVSGATKNGTVKSYAAAIYQEVLEALLPKQVLVAQGPCSLLKHLRKDLENPFEIRQVAFLGTVPSQLAVNVPFKTTLRKSELFETLETKIGCHETEPSILSHRDSRLNKPFDPYVGGVEKFNETASCFDMEDARLVMDVMKSELLERLATVLVPGGKPVAREESVILNGLVGEKYYDGMDMSTSCGYPFNTMGFGTNKRGFIEGEPGDYCLTRNKAVYEEFLSLDHAVCEGLVPDMVTCECAKDERLPLSKIYEKPKTRLFTILPFHYNMLVRKYFLDFSATMMRAHNDISSKVGINPEGLEWTTLAQQFLNVSSEGFSADYSSFDGRAPVFIFQWFCDMVDEFYGDLPNSSNSLARHALLMMASNHYTLCGDKLFRVVGGMPSGFSLTVLFNSLLNEFYMRYAFQRLLKKDINRPRTYGLTQRDFSQLFVAIYGDDNLVAVPLHMQWYSLPAIAEELAKVNVVIKNGLDKSADVGATTLSPLQELTFLSRGFRRHVTGYFMSPLKWVSVVEPCRWIRPAAESSATDSLLENIEGSLRAAFMHGEQVFTAFRNVISECLRERSIPVYSLPTYLELERHWLSEVTSTGEGILLVQDEKEMCNIPTNVPSAEQFSKEVNCFVPGIFFCGARTAKGLPDPAQYVIVNCVTAAHPKWIRGPVTWKDLENKIWAYTVSAIDIEVKRRIAQNMKTDLLFVCPGGIGMSIVCAALSTLASAQYTKAQVVRRMRQLASTEKLSSFAAGAGQYVLLAAQQGGVYKNDKSAISYGSNLFDRSLRIGNCVVIVGNPPLSVNPTAYWCTPSAGFRDVKTSYHYIRKQDPSATNLATALRQIKKREECLFLFFSTFQKVEAEWVLSALARCGENLGDLCSTDLLLVEKHAKMASNMSFGKICLEVARPLIGKCKIEVTKWENERVSTTLPIDARSSADPDIFILAVQQLKAGVYHTFSPVEAIKVLFLNGEFTAGWLAECVNTFYPLKECQQADEVFISLALWADLNPHNLHTFVSESLFADVERDIKYVTHDAEEDYWNLGQDFSNATESLGLSLRLHFQFSAKANHHVFRLPKQMPQVFYTLAALKLETKCRKSLRQPKLDLPPWVMLHHSGVENLDYISTDFIIPIISNV